MKKDIFLVLLGIAGGLLGVGVIFLTSQPPHGSAIRLLPPPTPDVWVIQVSGAVVQPGVYELPAGSRVQDAIQAAGGFAVEASSGSINQAAPLNDGENIIIPAKTPTFAAPQPKTSATRMPTMVGESVLSTSTVQFSTGEWINVNTATLDELDELPGIGPAMAQRIIDYRLANGLFSTIEAIMDVPGIGQATFDKIKGLITVGP